MSGAEILFYLFGSITVLAGLGVILFSNPVYCALSLAGSMISLAGLFALLGAKFLAAVQLVVYAGAVVVLFVMVLMLFDLKKDDRVFSKGIFSGFCKLAGAGAFLGVLLAVLMSLDFSLAPIQQEPAESEMITKEISRLLFTKYVLVFEIMGVLLTVIAIGAVALSRIEGGTHAD